MDLIKYFKEFPYWETFKLQWYYILHPIKHFKVLTETIKKGNK